MKIIKSIICILTLGLLFGRKKEKQIYTYAQFMKAGVLELIDILETAVMDTEDLYSDEKTACDIETRIIDSWERAMKKSQKVAVKKVGKRNFYSIREVNDMLYQKRDASPSTKEIKKEKKLTPEQTTLPNSPAKAVTGTPQKALPNSS
ncbi:MAG: hypothetical protein FWE01_00745 [Firmicutes bacterium]|nr:hypothetical protein [Bacillota bacterium]